MNDSKISVRYAKAIFESALEKKLLDKVYSDMIYISEFCKIGEVKELLESPIIIPSKKSEILHKVLGNNIESLSLSLVDMLVKNSRESFLSAVARVFIHETKDFKGITETVLTTAVRVNENNRKQIIDLISGVFKTKIELGEVIDKEIIGGFILKIEDNYIDASVRNKLRRIEKELRGKSLSS